MSKPLRDIIKEGVVLGRTQQICDIPPLKLETNVYDHQYIETSNVVEVYLGMSVSVVYKNDSELTESIDKACHHMAEMIQKDTKDKLWTLMREMCYDHRMKKYAERLSEIIATM
jgi:hypothetical protein